MPTKTTNTTTTRTHTRIPTLVSRIQHYCALLILVNDCLRYPTSPSPSPATRAQHIILTKKRAVLLKIVAKLEWQLLCLCMSLRTGSECKKQAASVRRWSPQG
jgi:hypothetical protein